MARFVISVPLVVIFLATTGASVAAPGQMQGYISTKGVDQEAQQVSLLQLIANPAKYNGKKVRVIGFLRLEFEGDSLYLHKEDYDHGISENAVWIDTPSHMTKAEQQTVNMHYVICEGVFRAQDHGHMGMFSGAISAINRMEVWPFLRTDKN